MVVLLCLCYIYFFNQKTAYEVRIRDWSSDVCSSDLAIRQVSPGALVTPGTVIATLDDIARVYVDFPVPETQMEMVAAGQRLEGTASAFPGRVFDGTVSVVAVRPDAATPPAVVRGGCGHPHPRPRPGVARPSRHGTGAGRDKS